ncbi:MAG: relaxase/mobilization nuclease domain-containing protein [Alphaproteobacteria bacterium]|nr:relaxase/mobilization nuclease domain-containing protein [Alphaproteobacteria bacterium]
MIPKRIDIEPANDDFAGLANYIAAAKDEGEKLESFWIENCNAGDGLDGLDLAIAEVKATQALNQRTKIGKTYHLMISFRDEHPPLDVLKDIESEFAKALGYAEHQRVVGTHVNTDNFHMHIAINKIHPDTLKAYTPLRDFKTLEEVSRAMEHKHGLKVDLGRSDKLQSERRPQRALDKEAHTWEQSFDGYVRENKAELMAALDQSSTWQDMHDGMARFSLQLQPYGNGLVIADANGKHRVKASSVDRLLSMKSLETRLGQFRPPVADRTAEQASDSQLDRSGDRANDRQPGQAGTAPQNDDLAKAFRQSETWQDLHVGLARYGLELRLQGNGLVLDSGKRGASIKASTIGRAYSKAALQKRLGAFQAPSRQAQQILATRGAAQHRAAGRGSATRPIPGARQRPLSGPRKQYRKRPITSHPGQARLWRRYLTLQRQRKSLLVLAFKTWRDFLIFEASTDPLAMAIVMSQRQIIEAIKPLRTPKRSANQELFR